MKTRIRSYCRLLLVLGGLLPLLGCSSEPAGPPVTKAASTNTNPPTPVQTNLAEAAEAPVETVPPQRMPLPPGVDEVVDLAQAQVGDAVLLEFIKNSTNAYDLDADQIVYLNDLGVSDAVLAAMIKRGNQLREQGAAPGSGAAPAPPQAVAAAAEPTPKAEGTEATTASPAPAPAAPVAAAPQPEAEPSPAPAAAAPVAAAEPQVVEVPVTQYVYGPPTTRVTYNYFYQTLAPYGTWIDLPSYGWCWQPTCAVVDLTWQPYCHRGRWVYTDWGYYWLSDYSWGWAPFHYGRWFHSPGRGWVWLPGSEWAPAWVTWRCGDSYSGWAPLPPAAGWHTGFGLTYHGSGVSVGVGFGLHSDRYAFVHNRHLFHPTLAHHRLPRHEVSKVYNRTTVINNITLGEDRRIFNRGVPTERIQTLTRQEVRKVEVRDLANGPPSPRRFERLERDGATLAVYRPKPPTDLTVSPASPIRTGPVPSRSQQEARQETSAKGGPVRTLEPTRRLVSSSPSGRAFAPIEPRSPSRAEPAPGITANPPVAKLTAEPTQPRPGVAAEAPSAPLSRRTVETPRTSLLSERAATSPSAARAQTLGRSPTLSRPYAPLTPRTPLVSTRPAQSQPLEPLATATPESPRSTLPYGRTSRPLVQAPAPYSSVPTRSTYSPPPAGVPSSGQGSYLNPTAPRTTRSWPAGPTLPSSRIEARKMEPIAPTFASPPKFATPTAPTVPSMSPVQPRSLPAGPSFTPPPSAISRPGFAAPTRTMPAPSYSPSAPSAPGPAISTRPSLRQSTTPGRSLQATPGMDPRRGSRP